MPSRVLIVDDDPATLRMMELGLRQEGHDVACASGGVEALATAKGFEPYVVLADLNMAGMTGIELCQRFAEIWPDVPVLVITAFGSMDTAIEAIRAGAYDFIPKPFDVEGLALAVERAVRHHELHGEIKRLRAAVGQAEWSTDLLGASPAMMELRALLERLARSDGTCLITGESGTGKEVIARVLHNHGKRRLGPFVPLNCAAVPESLLESELFGHTRGAFTDARSSRNGLLIDANHGTLFLDEIGDMPLSVQPKLLRALEERKVRPVGGNTEIPFDVRVIAATNRDLEWEVQEGRFREDLFYRLNVLHIPVPPLRSRGADVLLLAQHFIDRFAKQGTPSVRGISPAAAARLLAYPWPGNVRELRNCIERAIALTRFDHLAADDLPERVKTYQSRHVVVAGDDLEDVIPLEEVERRYVRRVLEVAGGNKSVAAQKLGISRKTLYRKLAGLGDDKT